MKYVPCNLCGRDDWRVRFPETMNNATAPDVSAFRCTSSSYGHHPQIVQCRHCGHVYANPRWDGDELIHAYEAVEDDTYVRERAGRVLTFRKHLQHLEKHVGPADGRALLDVGTYIGVFVEVACEAGWQACGIEPSAWAVSVAAGRGLPVIQGTQETIRQTGRQFDIVTMWDVIEHVDDPAGELDTAFKLLKPGGYVAVHTMDIDSLAARLLKERWPWLMDMHIHYFSQNTLAQMMRAIGFEIVWSGAQGRYLRLGYLASRVKGMNDLAGRIADGLARRLKLTQLAVPVNFGDLFTVYARRPPDGRK